MQPSGYSPILSLSPCTSVSCLFACWNLMQVGSKNDNGFAKNLRSVEIKCWVSGDNCNSSLMRAWHIPLHKQINTFFRHDQSCSWPWLEPDTKVRPCPTTWPCHPHCFWIICIFQSFKLTGGVYFMHIPFPGMYVGLNAVSMPPPHSHE